MGLGSRRLDPRKPFLPKELLLRLAAVMRRVYREEAKAGAVSGKPSDRLGSGNRFLGRKYGTAAAQRKNNSSRKLWENRGNIVTVDAGLFFFVGRGVDRDMKTR